MGIEQLRNYELEQVKRFLEPAVLDQDLLRFAVFEKNAIAIARARIPSISSPAVMLSEEGRRRRRQAKSTLYSVMDYCEATFFKILTGEMEQLLNEAQWKREVGLRKAAFAETLHEQRELRRMDVNFEAVMAQLRVQEYNAKAKGDGKLARDFEDIRFVHQLALEIHSSVVKDPVYIAGRSGEAIKIIGRLLDDLYKDETLSEAVKHQQAQAMLNMTKYFI